MNSFESFKKNIIVRSKCYTMSWREYTNDLFMQYLAALASLYIARTRSNGVLGSDSRRPPRALYWRGSRKINKHMLNMVARDSKFQRVK